MSRTKQVTVRGLPQLSQQGSRLPTLRPDQGPMKSLSSTLSPPDAHGEKGTVPETDTALPAAHTLEQSCIVCLPLVSQNRKVVWVNLNHISQQLERDNVTQLEEAFDRFPYMTPRETATLAQRCSLHPDQVKVWFIVQRLRYGISWECEDIHEVWERLCTSSLAQGEDREDGDQKKEEAESRQKGGEREEATEEKRAEEVGEREKAKKERVKDEGGEEKRRREVRGRREEKRGSREGGGKKERVVRGEGWKREVEEEKAAAVKKEMRKRKREIVMVKGRKKRRTQEEDRVKEGRIKRGRKRKDGVGMKVGKAPESETVPVIGKGQRAKEHQLSCVRPRIHTSQSSTPPQVLHQQRRSGPVPVVALTQLKEIIPAFQSSSGHRHQGRRNHPSTMEPFQVKLQRAQPVLWKSFQRSQKLTNQELLSLRNETRLGIKAIRKWFALSRQEALCQTQNRNSETPDHGSTTYAVPPLQSKVPNPVPLRDAQTLTLTQVASVKKDNIIPTTTTSRGPDLTPCREKVNKVRNKYKTQAQIELLRKVFLTCPFPGREDYDRLMMQTGLPRSLLVQWFGDTRYLVKNGIPRWLTREERDKIMATIERLHWMKALVKAKGRRDGGDIDWKGGTCGV